MHKHTEETDRDSRKCTGRMEIASEKRLIVIMGGGKEKHTTVVGEDDTAQRRAEPPVQRNYTLAEMKMVFLGGMHMVTRCQCFLYERGAGCVWKDTVLVCHHV